jgi:hypothetical protein
MKKQLSRTYYGEKIKQSNMVFEYRYYLLDEDGDMVDDNLEYSNRVFTTQNLLSIQDAIKECRLHECNNIELFCWVNDDNGNEIIQLICDVCNIEENEIFWIYDLHTSHVVLSSSIHVSMPAIILNDWKSYREQKNGGTK